MVVWGISGLWLGPSPHPAPKGDSTVWDAPAANGPGACLGALPTGKFLLPGRGAAAGAFQALCELLLKGAIKMTNVISSLWPHL